MATGKKSFVMYCDLIHTVSKLSDAKAGKLFKTILEYVNDQDPEVTDTLTAVAFEPIKHQLKRDLKDWEETKENRSKAGRLGGLRSGEVRSKTKQNEANVPLVKQNEANEAVTETVTVNVTDTVNVNEREIVGEVFYDVEELVKKNEIWLEKILMSIGATKDQANEALRKYHLYLEEKSQYPKQKKQLLAGFEKWLMNEKKFNGTHKQIPGTSEARIDALKKW